MIVVKIELHSAITGKVSRLATLLIDNIGGTKSRGNYRTRMYRHGAEPEFGQRKKGLIREGRVLDYPRLSKPVQTLVARALSAMRY